MANDPNDHIFELSRKVGEQTAEISQLKEAVEKLAVRLETITETNNQIRMGGRVAVLLLGLFGGAAGGKIAHWMGLLTDSAPHH